MDWPSVQASQYFRIIEKVETAAVVAVSGALAICMVFVWLIIDSRRG